MGTTRKHLSVKNLNCEGTIRTQVMH